MDRDTIPLDEAAHLLLNVRHAHRHRDPFHLYNTHISMTRWSHFFDEMRRDPAKYETLKRDMFRWWMDRILGRGGAP
jgi:hypothetical protein